MKSPFLTVESDRVASPYQAAQRIGAVVSLVLGLGVLSLPAGAATALADQPVFTSQVVPGNLALSLSVEYPTVSRVAHTDAYSSSANFLGYFDPAKCYGYNYVATETATAKNYFYPTAMAAVDASGNSLHTC